MKHCSAKSLSGMQYIIMTLSVSRLGYGSSAAILFPNRYNIVTELQTIVSERKVSQELWKTMPLFSQRLENGYGI